MEGLFWILGLGALALAVWIFVKFINMLDDVADIHSLLVDIRHEIQSLNKGKDKDN
jgi:hypothetical protein